jgi:hypothetical protein
MGSRSGRVMTDVSGLNQDAMVVNRRYSRNLSMAADLIP